MWNYYTRNVHAAGYNLHFKTELLLGQLDRHPLAAALTGGERILCRHTIYNEEEKKFQLRRLLQDFSAKWEEASAERDRNILLSALDRCFEKLSLFYKDRAFSHEREIRIVIPTDNGRIRQVHRNGGSQIYQFRKVRGAQVPFLALDVLEKGEVITGVTAGPALDKEMAVKGVEYMLYHYGFPKTCRVSSVPLRY